MVQTVKRSFIAVDVSTLPVAIFKIKDLSPKSHESSTVFRRSFSEPMQGQSCNFRTNSFHYLCPLTSMNIIRISHDLTLVSA